MDEQPIDPKEHQERLKGRLKAIVGRLATEANDRVSKRKSIEQRWIEDLEQYHGQYDAKTEANLAKAEKSQLFINLTRPKTDAMSARLSDLLFPTDDKNWGISPTPIPELSEGAKQSAQAARELRDKAKQAQEQAQIAEGQVDEEKLREAQQLEARATEVEQKNAEIQAQIDEGTKRSDRMAETIDDQLKESLYHAVARDMIEDAAKLGTGVCKGPVTGDKVRKGWKRSQTKAEDGSIQHGPFELQMSSGEQPAFRGVNIWSFFPDMDARTIDESEGVYERHLMNKKRLRGLAQLAGFDKDAIRRLLEQKPTMSVPSYLADLRKITRTQESISKSVYHVWEYTGPLSKEDMQDLAELSGDQGTQEDVAAVDELQEINAIVWFCQGEVLKFSIYPFDSGETMYSVFNLIKDESSILGYGIPAVMRDPQKALNAGWRAMMDNAGLASGSQVVIAIDLVEPADGDMTMRPRKIWLSKAGTTKDRRPFETFDIPMHQQEMANIIALSKEFIDEMTAMPAIAQGEQGTGVTKTAQGMTLLMNSANVVFRRIVKNFDDDVTTPNIRRAYDWNMQFNPDETIKGDYCVDARGSSVLLVREMQANNLFMIAMNLGGHPIYGPMLKNRDVLKKLFQAHMIPADDVLLTDDEIDATLNGASAEAEAQKAQAEAQAEAMDWEREKLGAEIEIKNMENGTKLQIAQLQRETAMMQMAEKMNLSLDQIEAKLTEGREARASKERIIAAEIAVTKEIGPSGGGIL